MCLICRPAWCLLLVRLEGGLRARGCKSLPPSCPAATGSRLTSSRYGSSFDGGRCAQRPPAVSPSPSTFLGALPRSPELHKHRTVGTDFQNALHFDEVNNDRDAFALGIRFLLALRRVPEHALALRFVRRDTRATMKLEQYPEPGNAMRPATEEMLTI